MKENELGFVKSKKKRPQYKVRKDINYSSYWNVYKWVGWKYFGFYKKTNFQPRLYGADATSENVLKIYLEKYNSETNGFDIVNVNDHPEYFV